jgi:archaeosortase B (VPXXXP-CTERM-specific)
MMGRIERHDHAGSAPPPPAGGDPSFVGLVVRFLGYLFVASLAFSLGGVHERLTLFQSTIAYGAAVGARLLGQTVEVDGPVIAVNGASAINVNHECTGIFVLIIYAAFLLAYPATWQRRVLGILAGGVILEAVNVARLSVLAMIAARWPSLFEYFHEYLWQGIFVAMLALLVASWIENVNRQALVPR